MPQRGNIFKRKGNWYVRFQVGGREVWRSAGRSRQAAQELLGRMRGEAERSSLGLPRSVRSTPTLKAWAPKYLAWAKQHKRSWDNAGEETDHQNFRQPDNGNRAQRPIRSDATATRPEATRQAATPDTRQALGTAQSQTTTSASGPPYLYPFPSALRALLALDGGRELSSLLASGAQASAGEPMGCFGESGSGCACAGFDLADRQAVPMPPPIGGESADRLDKAEGERL